MDKIKVSVIVPVYNVEDYIDRCIDSVLTQSYQNFELVLVNDGSTDSSYNHILKYGADKRISIINKNNSGQSDSRYQGLLKATGDYILFVDSDDFIAPDALETFIEHSRNGLVDAIFARYRLVDENCHELRVQPLYNTNELRDKCIIADALRIKNFKSSLCLKIIKREILMDAFKDEVRTTRINEDVLLSILIALRCKHVVFSNTIIYNVLQRSNSLTRGVNPQIMSVHNRIFMIIKDELNNKKLFPTFQKDYYFGYSKCVLFALALCAQKTKDKEQYLDFSNVLQLNTLLGYDGCYSIFANKPIIYAIMCITILHKKIFYSINRLLKSLLIY